MWFDNRGALQVFIEEQAKFGVEAMLRIHPARPLEPILKSMLEVAVKELKTPNKDNIDKIFNKVLGIERISNSWSWENMSRDTAIRLLNEILHTRHDIAHQSRTKNSLSFDKNFEYMRHLYNLAYLINYESSKKLAAFEGVEFSRPIEMPSLSE